MSATSGSHPSRAALTGEVTRLLSASADGNSAAFDELIPLVYEDLKQIAHRRLRSERPDHTLDTTAVVHEAYLHLVGQAGIDWRSRAHFFGVAAKVIRNVLVDYSRRRTARKRGGGGIHVPLREELQGREPRVIDLLAVDQALSRLARHDARLERIVECRFFGGMSMEETAEALGVSLRTVERDWTRAKAYLHRELEERDESAPPGAETA